LQWLALDDQLCERFHPELVGIEAALARAGGAASWRRAPSAIALVRSIAVLRSTAPQLLDAPLSEIL
jgi:hypothetical protein